MNSELERVSLHLLLNQTTSLEELEEDVGLHPARSRQCIDQINEKLEEYGGVLVSLKKDGDIEVSLQTKEHLYFLLKENTFSSFDYLAPELRERLIIIKLLMHGEGDSLQDLADFAGVSKNTMINDLKGVKKALLRQSLTLKYSRVYGYRVLGNELQCRTMLMATLKHVLLRRGAAALLERKDLLQKDERFFMKQRLLEVERRLSISFTDEQLEDLPVLLLALLTRMQRTEGVCESEFKEYELTQTNEYDVIKDLFWHFPNLSESDKVYLTIQVLSANMLDSSLNFLHLHKLEQAVDAFLKELEPSLATSLAGKRGLKQKLIHHLKPALFRVKFGFSIRNHLTEEFMTEYSSIFAIVKSSLAPLEMLANRIFNDEEIVYLAMHIQAWIYQSNEEEEYDYRALVVCRNGTSVSKLLLEGLKGLFPSIHFVGAFAERTYHEREEEVDFIFSTVELNTRKKVFLTHPILNKANRAALKKMVYQCVDSDVSLRVSKLMNELKEYVQPEDQSKVHQKITHYLKNSRKPVEQLEEKTEETLFPFSTDHILFAEDGMDWKKAILYTIEPLLQRKSITKEYIEKTVELFEAEGERMMLGPSVYLPHASPDDGAIRNDFSLLICRKPVKVRDDQEAKVMIVLSPSRDNQHVATLLHLNELFLNEKVANRIIQAKTKREVVELLSLPS
ncbi:BglG family transcription antiterminator [Metabacillus arenae]|uniref:Ascorbate-specific PTS system EIIA component n=1 Tax=Metabacillus arenae TaxID=2771434 RepID=A0A926NEK9_9BACI|nr:BglG family transcription antiterminator [Metabacillus arenae]MBD1382807.1 BglG family transcription antiterminator [Metabacillus arenae]